MLNCANLFNPNRTYALTACNMADNGLTTASNFAGALGSHMVSQFDRFQEFVVSKPSVEKTAETVQRGFTGMLATGFFVATFDSAYQSTNALFKGKIVDSLVCGMVATIGAAATFMFTSMTLDPVGYVQFMKLQ